MTTDPVHSSPAICSACGESNDAAALFCARCTAPLGVASLADLTDADRRTCLSALFEVLGASLQSPVAEVADRSLWMAYLSAFWLRPETALVLYAEALALSNLKSRFPHLKSSPWLDLGCGDGIHAALYSGWKFDSSFDAFQSLDLSAADMYHHWNPADFSINFTSRGETLAHGFDIKPTAIQRANALGAFENVQQADATDLPLQDRSVGTIFSNMLRDLGGTLPAALDECRRVLASDGLIMLSTMTPAYAKHLHFAPAAREADAVGDVDRARQLLRLDRGRSVFCRQQLSVDEWQVLLAGHGLKIVAVEPVAGPAVIRLWDIGLRPFSVQLLQQRKSLSAIKSVAAEFLARCLEPLASNPAAGEACMNILAVTQA